MQSEGQLDETKCPIRDFFFLTLHCIVAMSSCIFFLKLITTFRGTANECKALKKTNQT